MLASTPQQAAEWTQRPQFPCQARPAAEATAPDWTRPDSPCAEAHRSPDRPGCRSCSSTGYRATEDSVPALGQAHASLGVEMSFRASAARYRLALAFTDPPAASPTNSRAGVWLLASSRHCLVRARNRTQSNRLSWTFPLPQSSHPRSFPPPCAVPEIRTVQQDSPHEVFGPFSTSSQEDSPTRGSAPAVFRLRRCSGLDGFLPSWPCRLVSSGGTLGVPGPHSLNPALPREQRTFE